MFILIIFINLYMFLATMCPSSGETTVLMLRLVLVILCRWLSGMQEHMLLHTRQCTKLALFTRLYMDGWSTNHKISNTFLLLHVKLHLLKHPSLALRQVINPMPLPLLKAASCTVSLMSVFSAITTENRLKLKWINFLSFILMCGNSSIIFLVVNPDKIIPGV